MTSTWVLLRGLTREARHWADFPDRLREAIPGATVLTPDLPGCGTLNDIESPASIEAIAESCRTRVLATGASPPYYLLGLSLGAMTATGWASARPDELAGCVLINPSLRSFSPPHHRLRPSAWPTLLRLLATREARGKEEIVLRLTARSESVDVLDMWTNYRRERPVSLANALRQLLAASRFRPRERPPVPILVLASGGDRLVNPECSRAIRRAWHTDYAEHDRAGHDLPLDDAPWVIEQVCRWAMRPGGDCRNSAMAPRQPIR